MNQVMESDNIQGEQREELPQFKIGDLISVHYKILEEGAKERTQIFTGTVIARKGKGKAETVSLYRIAYGSAMERVIPVRSPRVAKIEVVKSGFSRKSKLYHLRGAFGKKAKIQEKLSKKLAGKGDTPMKIDNEESSNGFVSPSSKKIKNEKS